MEVTEGRQWLWKTLYLQGNTFAAFFIKLFLYSFGIYSAWWRNVTGKRHWKQFKQQEKTKQATNISYKLLISLSMILENVTVEMKLAGILNPPDKWIKGTG